MISSSEYDIVGTKKKRIGRCVTGIENKKKISDKCLTDRDK